MKIKVKFINGNNTIYDCDKEDILSLKNLIAIEKNILEDNIKLIYRGKILKNEDNFELHKIDENCTLHCVVRKVNSQNMNTSASNVNIQDQNISSSNENDLQNSVDSITNLNNLLQNVNLSENNFPNIFQNLDPTLINQINTMYQIPQFRELIISNTLTRLNLPIESPYRHVIENNISTLLQSPQMTNQIINNINNLSQTSLNETPQNSINFLNETPQTNVNCEINIEELKNKYLSEFEDIKNMGFDNEELILKTLDQSQGSVVISINKLLN